MTQTPVYVFGHRNPDTDAICSAVAYAELLRQTGLPEAQAACCGPPNQRTQFALEAAGIDAPPMIVDVRPEVIDVCRRQVVVAHQDDMFFEVYQKLQQHGLRSIPVLDDEQRLVGIISLIELLQLVFRDQDQTHGSRAVTSSLTKVCEALGGTFQFSNEPDASADFLLMVGAMSAQGFTERLHRYPAERLLVVCGDRPTIQLPALEHGVRGLVITGNYELSPGLLQLAQLRGVSVIRSPLDTANTTIRIKSARLIQSAITTDFVQLLGHQPIAEVRAELERTNQPIFPVMDDGGELLGVLSKSDMLSLPRPRLVLVDHNELGQAVAGAEEAEILEVVDHHRLGGSLRSTQPIRMSLEPVGSTCTIITRRYQQLGVTPEPGIALCLAAGIISDTLNLRSPTSTPIDAEALQWLEPLCDRSLNDFARDFFATGSALRCSSAAQVIAEDCKLFEEHRHRFSISQIEEIGFDLFWERKPELQAALERQSGEAGLDFAALLVTDISTNGSLLMMSKEPLGWEAINYPKVDRSLYRLDDIVSRKKQLLPLFARLLANTPAADRQWQPSS